ncbi:universal stress protein [Peristeroidobacter agariperforans]|uniref:universal stress protein n=1 Tax=Peristeroidobacter agariperforans TaxID=268404 RepID=UPI00101BFA50|nr:universal stress protein [Peristeroidobacter agariperforans]
MTPPVRAVVAATDFSFSAHRAARRAGALAKDIGAKLDLLHVVDSSTAQLLLRRSPAFDVEQPLRLEAKRGLDSLAEDIVAAGGVVHDRVLREGRVMDEILAVSASSDLLVLGPRGVNPLRDFILGSTAERIARMVECPMLVVKQDPQIPYDNVLVPVDFSRYSAPSLQFASKLAPRATLHVFHALDSSLKPRLRSAGVTEDGVAAYTDELQREATVSMAELTATPLGQPVISTVQMGDARVNIYERAAASQCTLIVMGKQGRSWLSEQVLGSVTRRVLERAVCDVAVVPQS